MHDPRFLMLLDALVMAFCVLNLLRSFKTGRARIWLGGTATRDHEPQLYWRYVWQGWGFLVFAAAIFAALLISPASFR